MPLAAAALLLWGVTGVLVKYAYAYYGANEANIASEANLALMIAVGGLLTLGVYGFIFGRKGAASGREWSRSFLPMATMALGGCWPPSPTRPGRRRSSRRSRARIPWSLWASRGRS